MFDSRWWAGFWLGVVVGVVYMVGVLLLEFHTSHVDWSRPAEVAEEADRRAASVEGDCPLLWAEVTGLEADVLRFWPHLTETDAQQYVSAAALENSPNGPFMSTLEACYGGGG